MNNDRLAQTLLQNGNRFGRQHVAFHSKHAYPSYVVQYRMMPESTAATLPVVRAQCSAQCISVSVADKRVYMSSPRTPENVFVIVVVNLNTLKASRATLFNAHKVASANAMIKFIAALDKDEIVVVAATKPSIPIKRSPMAVDVLRSLRSVGGSLHVLECAYVLVGAKHPYLLNGLVHEDHQPGKAAVSVDARVIRHNRDTITPNLQKRGDMLNDMFPVRWQFQVNSKRHGEPWQDVRGWSSQLTSAYRDGKVQTIIDGHTADLVKMKMRGFKIRCLNWKGETLSPREDQIFDLQNRR